MHVSSFYRHVLLISSYCELASRLDLNENYRQYPVNWKNGSLIVNVTCSNRDYYLFYLKATFSMVLIVSWCSDFLSSCYLCRSFEASAYACS